MANNESKRLIKNTGIIAIGSLSTKLVSFFLLPLYTGILSQEEYGTYDYILSIMTFVIPLVTLLVSESMFRFLIDAKGADDRKRIISETFVITLTGLTVFCVVGGVFLTATNNNYTLCILGYGITYVLASLIPAILRGEGRMTAYAVCNFTVTFITLITNVLAIAVFRLGVTGLFLGFIVSHALSFIIFSIEMKLWRYLDFTRVTKKGVTSIVKYSIPMVPNKLSWSIVDLAGRIIVTNVIGVAANGIYSIANKFPTLINTFYQFFYQAWTESSARALKDGKEEAEKFYNFIYEKLKRILIAIVIMLVACMPVAFKLMINPNFSEAYYYVPLLAFGMFFSNISGFYGGIFTAYKDTKMLGISTCVGAVINIIINLALIKIIGLHAAAVATFTSECVIAGYRCNQTKKYIKLKGNPKFLSACLLMAVVICGFYYVNTWWSFAVNFVLGAVFSLYINRAVAGEILGMILRKKTRKGI
ncbi:MAG: oligosaccharide flippase family protein [Clostridia bacterium]|nr:oligosaccharide flippase family protein [Clostridia bacterium]